MTEDIAASPELAALWERVAVIPDEFLRHHFQATLERLGRDLALVEHAVRMLERADQPTLLDVLS